MGTLELGDGTSIRTASQMLGLFMGELSLQLAGWRERLDHDPQSCSEIEQEVQLSFVMGAGMLIAGPLAPVICWPRPPSRHE